MYPNRTINNATFSLPTTFPCFHHHSLYTVFLTTGFQSPSLVLKISKNKLTPELVKKGIVSAHFHFYAITILFYAAVLTTIQSSPSRVLVILQQLAGLPLDELTAYHTHITNVLPSLLDSTIPRRILNLCLQIWKELSIIVSRR